MKVVDAGYLLDLHIHSIYSKGKDGSKVNYNTIEHVGELVEKLTKNNVQLCAITDHDVFGYDMYMALKGYESEENCSVIKVFPGVEFSVEFEGQSSNAVVHVITIFDDTNIDKISKISSFLTDESGQPAYDCEMAFSEERFLSILRKINLDTVLIAHQKNTLTSHQVRNSDANSVGEEKFKEFIHTDFFEAYEFKNKKMKSLISTISFQKVLLKTYALLPGQIVMIGGFIQKRLPLIT